MLRAIAAIFVLSTFAVHVQAAEKSEELVISKITIAVSKFEEMCQFYNKVLRIDLKKFKAHGAELASAKAGSLEILLCPKSIAGIKADENTIQLMYSVPDIKAAVAEALANGGKSLNEVYDHEGVLFAAVRDPDGNSLELRQPRNASAKAEQSK